MLLSLLPHSTTQLDDQQKCCSIEGLGYHFDSRNATILGQTKGMGLLSTQPAIGNQTKILP